MTSSNSYSHLVIKSTTGFDRLETTNQALTVATAALTAEVPTSVWLTGDSVFLAVPGRANEFELAHGMGFADMIEMIRTHGTLTACVQCVVRRGLTAADLLDGVRIAGAASFVDEIMRAGTQALVY